MEKADILFNADKKSQKKQKKCIKKVLKKLSKYEKELIETLQGDNTVEVIEDLEKKLTLTHAQREKGLKILSEMKAEQKKKVSK